MNMLEFSLKNSVKVFEDMDEITLSVGVLENNIITIPKHGEDISEEFLDIFSRLIANKEVQIERHNKNFKELMNIYNLGFLQVRELFIEDRVLVIDLDSIGVNNIENSERIVYKSLYDILEKRDLEIIINKTDALKYKEVVKKAKEKLTEYSNVIILGGLHHLNKLLAINHILTESLKKGIFFTYDTFTCFVVGVDSTMGTGCFQCFISNLLNHKQLSNSKYCSVHLEIPIDMNLFLLSILNSELYNMINNKESIVYGNVISYIPKLYQYTFDFNRRTVLCSNCIERFYDSFEEQNVAAINLIKNI